jgi:hypothetical protein
MRPGRPAEPSRYGALRNLEPKHGTCHDIPESQRGKLIVSTIRNPFDWYVSQYEFRWWTRAFSYESPTQPTPVGFALEQVLPTFMRENESFPDITFEDFLKLCHRAADTYNQGLNCGLGLYTHGFVRYFFRRPEEAIRRIDHSYAGWQQSSSDMVDVVLLRTHRLNDQLPAFLVSMGYAANDVKFVYGLDRIFPMGMGRREDQHWEGYYTPTTKRLVRKLDWMLFEIFPEFDV